MHINPFPNKPRFLRVYSKGLLKTPWEKEKLLITSNFSFSHSVFYPLREHFCHFHQIVCKLFQFGRVLKFVFWERVNLPDTAEELDGSHHPRYTRCGGIFPVKNIHATWLEYRRNEVF